MFSLKSLVLAAFAYTVASASIVPLSVRQEAEHIDAALLSVRSASPIHFEAVNASGSNFWIFKDTNTFCPIPAPECAGYPNQTIITVYKNASLEYQAFMDANVPGGQNVYVRESGALAFTEPHEEYVFPPNSYTNGFSYSTNENNITFLTFTGGQANTFLACPTTSAATPTSYQVFANVVGFNDTVVPAGDTTKCLGFGLIAEPIAGDSFGAFQYE